MSSTSSVVSTRLNSELQMSNCTQAVLPLLAAATIG